MIINILHVRLWELWQDAKRYFSKIQKTHFLSEIKTANVNFVMNNLANYKFSLLSALKKI